MTEVLCHFALGTWKEVATFIATEVFCVRFDDVQLFSRNVRAIDTSQQSKDRGVEVQR
jgi:hypothetical protein